MIRGSTEIARSPDEVWAYVDDLTRHTEWQHGLESVELVSGQGVGARVKETRKVPGGRRNFEYELTEHDPPKRMSFRVLNGPIRPYGTMTLAPAAAGTKVDFEMDFEGHGFGKLLLGFVRRDARKIVPLDLAQLKQRLESGS